MTTLGLVRGVASYADSSFETCVSARSRRWWMATCSVPMSSRRSSMRRVRRPIETALV
jgi:hypothetical protein